MNDSATLGVAPDHVAAFLAPFLLPFAIWIFFGLVGLLDRLGVPAAARFLDGYRESSSLTRIVAGLLVLAGLAHLVLIPAHLGEAQTLALLFALDGLGFVGLGIAAFVWRPWRAIAAILLVATLGEYLRYLMSGREQLDEVGLVCYFVELVILALIWVPRDQPALKPLAYN